MKRTAGPPADNDAMLMTLELFRCMIKVPAIVGISTEEEPGLDEWVVEQREAILKKHPELKDGDQRRSDEAQMFLALLILKESRKRRNLLKKKKTAANKKGVARANKTRRVPQKAKKQTQPPKRSASSHKTQKTPKACSIKREVNN